MSSHVQLFMRLTTKCFAEDGFGRKSYSGDTGSEGAVIKNEVLNDMIDHIVDV